MNDTLDYTLSREEGDGAVVAINLHGHDYGEVEALTAALAVWESEELDLIDYDDYDDLPDPPYTPEWGFSRPRKVWLRHIPDPDGWTWHHYVTKGGPGARPVTVVEPLMPLTMCRVCGKQWQAAYPEGYDLVADPADTDKRGYVPLCREHARAVDDFRSDVNKSVGLDCPDCGHWLGLHGRYEHGPDFPCGLSYQAPCPCTHVTPHLMVLDLNDMRDEYRAGWSR